MKINILLVFLIFLHSACSNDKGRVNLTDEKQSSNEITSDLYLNSLNTKKTGVDFTNYVKENPLRNQTLYDYFYNGAGVAICDFNNDGLPDIFFCGNDAPNRIYENLGDFKFQDKTIESLPKSENWTMGVTVVDLNDDGYQDIYLSNSGPDKIPQKLKNELLINNGDFTFRQEAHLWGIDIVAHSIQSHFFDYDKDGDLDLWINNHGDIKNLKKQGQKFQSENMASKGWDFVKFLSRINSPDWTRSKLMLLQNNNGKFVDVSAKAGINSFAFGLGLSVADFNNDGNIDVFIGNDYTIPDYYFLNNGDGTFINSIDMLNHTSYFSMGSDAADYNNDGILDLVVVDMTPKDHYRNKTLMPSMNVDVFNWLSHTNKFVKQFMLNNFHIGTGNGYFSEIGNALGMSLTDWSWAPLLADFDNDGDKDLYISNGYLRDTKNNDYRDRLKRLNLEQGKQMTPELNFQELLNCKSFPVKNAIYKNKGALKFKDVSYEASNLSASFSNGVAYGDLDNDGDLDVVINNLNSPASILENQSKKQNFLNVKLNGNKSALIQHAKLLLYCSNGIQLQEYSFTKGYLSYVEPIAHFGLGAINEIDSLLIEWPNSTVSVLKEVNINQLLQIDYNNILKSKSGQSKFVSEFEDISNDLLGKGLHHQEEFYNDFHHETLLPQKYSTLGPSLSVGDLNNDGLSDFHVGGSQGYSGFTFFNNSDGSISSRNQTSFEQDALFEDLGSVIFDVDNDGDMDLYLCSGGGGEIKDVNLLQDRLYLNDGSGILTKDINALPTITSSTKAVLAFDYDNDKDLDLFVGGRNVPGAYPSKAISYLLNNDGGIFKNIISKDLEESLPNMVTDIETLDYNNDGYLDLLIVGEWTSPKLFLNNTEGGFKEEKIEMLQNISGWYHSISKGDFNSDGVMDYVLGNQGLNNKFHPSTKKPLYLYYDDFDDNGKQDIVLAKIYKGKTVPVRGKECSSEQMPILNDRFKTYDEFASASLGEILGEQKLKDSKKLVATTFSSKILLSKEKSFEIKELPFPAQWGPLLDAAVRDINQDGHLDLIIAGNMFNTEPETPSYDANKGMILYGKGNGDFNAEFNIEKTGLNLKYNTKQIKFLDHSESRYGILAVNNNDRLQFYIKAQ